MDYTCLVVGAGASAGFILFFFSWFLVGTLSAFLL